MRGGKMHDGLSMHDHKGRRDHQYSLVVLSARDIIALLALPAGESLTLGGGAAPIFWLRRREA
jgi:hypothetical protein